MSHRIVSGLLLVLLALAGGCDALEGARAAAMKAARDQAREEMERIVQESVSDAFDDLDILPAPTELPTPEEQE